MPVTNLEPGNRVQLPSEWTDALGIQRQVLVDRREDGILIRPVSPTASPPATWDEIFATRLAVGVRGENGDDVDEGAGDNFLF